jgi:hypothetical protein
VLCGRGDVTVFDAAQVSRCMAMRSNRAGQRLCSSVFARLFFFFGTNE